MTLVELIGVLAVILILAGAAIPVALRTLDRIAREKELASLRALGDALQLGIMKTRSVPAQSTWHLFIAGNSGMDVKSVTNNLRNRSRVMHFDKRSTWFNSVGITTATPYNQAAPGLASLPDNARVIFATHIGGEISQIFAALTDTQFEDLWKAPAGTIPPSVRGTWNGDQHDILIHRVSLAPLFVRLLVSTYTPGTNGLGWYGFEGKAPVSNAPPGDGYAAYYLRGTELNLRSSSDTNTAPDHTEILQEDTSWVFENNVWQTSIVGPRPSPGLSDITDIVDAFLKAYPNTNSYWYTSSVPRTQQALVVITMRDYMSNYSRWATSNFTDTAKTDLQLEDKRVAMMDAMQGLFSQASHWTNVPPPNVP